MKRIFLLMLLFPMFAFATTQNSWVSNVSRSSMDYTMPKNGFIIKYDTGLKIATFVVYYLATNEFNGTNARLSHFVSEPTLSRKHRAQNSDYAGNGFDKGHMANAEDMAYSFPSERDSFLLSNTVPQDPNFNRGIWKTLEEQTRVWAEQYGGCLIITGTISARSNNRTIGSNHITVPQYMYKVLVFPNTNSYAFVFKNTNYSATQTALSNFITTVPRIEKMAGVVFFRKFDYNFKKKVYRFNSKIR